MGCHQAKLQKRNKLSYEIDKSDQFSDKDSFPNNLKRSSVETMISNSVNEYKINEDDIYKLDLSKYQHPRIRRIKDQAYITGGVDPDIQIVY